MKIAIATHKGLWYLNFKDGQMTLGKVSSGYYYGLVAAKNGILASRRIAPHEKTSPTAFELWSKEGQFLMVPDLDGRVIQDVHQITATNRGVYVCGGTQQNAIAFTDPALKEFEWLVRLPFHTTEGYDHVNSIYCTSEEDLWVMKHNLLDMVSYIAHMRHVGDELVWCQNYLLEEKGCHNLIVLGDWAYYNSSHTGEVKAVNLSSYDPEDWTKKGNVETKSILVRPFAHLKGMALINDRTLLVGISESTETNLRFFSNSALGLIDLDSATLADVLPLRDSYYQPIGNINEIRVIGTDND